MHSGHDGRYAPSPSGPLHLGNLRTALLAWLFARSQGARFVLRIEDLDPDRSRAEHAERALADLAAIGLDWDGSPLRQSDRGALYREAFEHLRAAGRVYPCWCSRAEIRAAASAPHAAEGECYPGTCRRLSARERAAREAARPPSAWRLDARSESVAFSDALHGRRGSTVDDFVLWRGDGVAAYNLAVVVDDAAQGIGEVVRGDDLLATTPRQVLLQRLLALPTVRYAHVPLVIGADGQRLAKRHGAVTLADRLARGEQLTDVLAWLASSSGLQKVARPARAGDLLDGFDPSAIVREPAVLA